MKIILEENQIRLLQEGLKKIDRLANKADTNPTEAQKKAGNYKMGHLKFAGFDISIENPKGSKRYWTDENGKKGYNFMKNHYGYFTRTLGYDGDQIDVFLGPDEDFETVYVVDQNNSEKKFDESKVMLGFDNKTEAKKAYMANFSKDWKGFRAITAVPKDVFKEWLYSGKKQRKPFSEYVAIKNNVTEGKNKILKEMIQNNNNNAQLRLARKLKNDEFYTRRDDIDLELGNYEKAFPGKIVYCNCDDHTKSNFYGYFKENFNRLGLRGLIATGINSEGRGVYGTYDGQNEQAGYLQGSGSFSSPESLQLLQKSDIVVSNPPFSLFRDYIKVLLESGKKFLVLGSMQAIKYKDIFELFKTHQLRTGYTGFNKGMYFNVPDDFEYSPNYIGKKEIDGQKVGRVSGIAWFTNMGTDNKAFREIQLTEKYSAEKYPVYSNYDAIEAKQLENVPYDYDGNIGVSFTVMDKKRSDGYIHCLGPNGEDIKFDVVDKVGNPKIGDKNIYTRVIIKRV